jgi:hypothetical protein
METTSKTSGIALLMALTLVQVGCTLPKPSEPSPSSPPPVATPPVVPETSSEPVAESGPGGSSPTGTEARQRRAESEAEMAQRETTEAEAEAALERARADQVALENAERDFRVQREAGALDGSEASDYAVYIAGLRRKLAEDCLELLERGIEIPDDLDCDLVRTEQVAASREQSSSRGRSSAEMTRELDEELRESLGEFDEAMIRGPIRVGDGRGNGPAGRGYDPDGYEDTAGAAAGDAAASATETTSAAEQDSDNAATQNESEHAALGDRGKNAPSETKRDADTVDDDDIVARQLREAAEKETDPALKEKLWEEYRRYKKGVL